MNHRRIFINNGKQLYQIFSFQQHKDGSIYVGWPGFSETKWITNIVTNKGPLGVLFSSEEEGKLSIHGSGMATFRSHNDSKEHNLIIKGNHLLNKEKNIAGARHLFTAFIKEPIYVPISPAFNRKSDYAIESKEKLTPCFIIFFAIPQTGVNINFEFSLSIDEMNNIPGDMLGGHLFSLRYHDLFWFAYRTKHMDVWPKHTIICYDDGFKVPIFIGTAKGQLRVDYRMPEYLLKDKQFTIKCNCK